VEGTGSALCPLVRFGISGVSDCSARGADHLAITKQTEGPTADFNKSIPFKLENGTVKTR
jgi:hypothetical protein